MIPPGGQQILNVRLRGKRPASEVMILTRKWRLDWEPIVYANTAGAYDWAFITGLPAIVVTELALPYDRLFCDVLRAVKPHLLRYFFVDADVGGYAYLQDGVRLSPNLEFEDRSWRRFFKELTDATH